MPLAIRDHTMCVAPFCAARFNAEFRERDCPNPCPHHPDEAVTPRSSGTSRAWKRSPVAGTRSSSS